MFLITCSGIDAGMDISIFILEKFRRQFKFNSACSIEGFRDLRSYFESKDATQWRR